MYTREIHAKKIYTPRALDGCSGQQPIEHIGHWLFIANLRFNNPLTCDLIIRQCPKHSPQRHLFIPNLPALFRLQDQHLISILHRRPSLLAFP
jgi:hypothetical protein